LTAWCESFLAVAASCSVGEHVNMSPGHGSTELFPRLGQIFYLEGNDLLHLQNVKSSTLIVQNLLHPCRDTISSFYMKIDQRVPNPDGSWRHSRASRPKIAQEQRPL